MKESAAVDPAWMDRARQAWKSKDNAPPEPKWTAYWIRKFKVYLIRRGKGKLPSEVPSVGVIGSFCRFIESKWECEDWQVQQARVALGWFGMVCGFRGAEKDAGRPDLGGTVERDAGVRAEPPILPMPWLLDSRLAGKFSNWSEMVLAECRKRGLAIRTEKTYQQWCVRFSKWWEKVADDSAAAPEVGKLGEVVENAVIGFMDHLAIEAGLVATSQRQALNGVSFLVTKVLGLETLDFSGFVQGKRRKNLPVVLSVDEVQRVLLKMKGEHRLAAELLYGSGLRLLECARLRLKDLDCFSALRFVQVSS